MVGESWPLDLNRAFFDLLRDRFRHRLCFVIARRDGEIVAGTTNVVKGPALYGRYWGALEPIRHLHFDVCYYAAIEPLGRESTPWEGRQGSDTVGDSHGRRQQHP